MSFATRSLRIGLDNGGVCSKHAERPKDGEAHVSRAELDMEGVEEGLGALKAARHVLSLESFSGRARALATQAEITERFPGLFDAFHFTKNKDFKADVCEHLGLDVMVDDTMEVVEQVANQNPSMLVLWYQGDPSFDDKRSLSDAIVKQGNVQIVRSWSELVAACTLESTMTPSRKQAAQAVGLPKQRIGFLDAKQWSKRIY